MSTITARRHFGALDITGLLAVDGALEVLVSLWADEDARDLLAQAAAANKVLDGDAESSDDEALAKARLDDALASLRVMLLGRKVRVGLEDAIDLREALIEARLGQGRADSWQAGRRIA